MLAPSLTGLVLLPGRMSGLQGAQVAHGRDAHPISLPKHKHLHLKIADKNKKTSCQLCYAPSVTLIHHCVHLIQSSQQSSDMGVVMLVFQMGKLKPN